jgi:DNA polymerase III epsilon subunit-like protein
MQWADTPVDVATKVYFDLETSGLRPDRGARITEIAVVGSRDARMSWQWADVETERPVGGDCYDRTVTPHLARLTDVLTRGVVIGHNLSFDFDFLTYEIERLRKRADPDAAALLKGVGLRVRFVDTLGLARRLVDVSRYELGALLEHFGASPEEPLHTALGDAFATRALFARLVDHPDVTTLADAGLQKLAW